VASEHPFESDQRQERGAGDGLKGGREYAHIQVKRAPTKERERQRERDREKTDRPNRRASEIEREPIIEAQAISP
jgi:hypothetical protein